MSAKESAFQRSGDMRRQRQKAREPEEFLDHNVNRAVKRIDSVGASADAMVDGAR